jgi:hypothetical protein
MSNKQPFGSFKNRSTNVTTVNDRPIDFEHLSATNNTYTVQGGPGIDANGNPLPWPNPGWTPTADQPDPPPMPLGHSLARQWGDKSAFHVGSNYAEQEGDTTVVSVGNSSTKRTGWANNVQDGNTFTTQINPVGGNFSTSFFTLGFQVGSKVNVSASLDVSLTTGFKCVLNRSATLNIFPATEPKYTLSGKGFGVVNETAEFATKVKNVVADSLETLSNRIDTVSLTQDHVTTALNHKVISLQTEATAIQQNFTTMASKGVTCTFDLAEFKLTAASLTFTGVTIKLG